MEKNRIFTKKQIFISVACCLIPIVIGFLLYNKLPEQIPTHFNFEGKADGWSSRIGAIFLIPLFCAGIDLFCLLITNVDPKRANIHQSAGKVLLFIVPVLDNVIQTVIYMIALGYKIEIGTITFFLLGILFIVLGNILPKVKQNYVFGVRTPWSLDNPENWIMTTRLSSKMMILSGLILIVFGLFNKNWAYILGIVIMLVLTCIIPYIYSYRFYQKHQGKR